MKLDGNNISISYDSKEYESLSGGEKTKVDIIIQLAIRNMLCDYSNFSTNILVVDEITDFLDEQSADNVYSLISGLDVETIFIISHRGDFSIPTDNQLVIVKRSNKCSEIMI